MEIVDNGIGLDKTKNRKKDVFGLTDMKERVNLLHGKLSISGKHGTGTCVKVELPYREE